MGKCGITYEVYHIVKYERDKDGNIVEAEQIVYDSFSLKLSTNKDIVTVYVNPDPNSAGSYPAEEYTVIIRGYLQKNPSVQGFTRINVSFKDCIKAVILLK